METFPQEPIDPITVWRRMNVLVYAMNRRDPLAEIIRPGPNGHLEFGSVVGRGGDDSLQNVAAAHVTGMIAFLKTRSDISCVADARRYLRAGVGS